MSGRSRQVKIEILGDAKGVDQAFNDVAESTGGLTDKLSTIGKIGTAALVGLGGAAVGAFAVGFGKAAEAEVAVDRLQAQLGLTEEEAKRLGDVAENVFEGAWGDSVPGVLEDIQVLRANLGDMSDEDLQRLTEKFLTIEDLWAAPVEETSRTVKTLRDNFDGLTEDQALDIITRGFQEGGDFAGDMLDTLNEYAPAFSNIGVDAEQFMGILIAGSEAGAFNIDKVGDAMKEFEIRAQDGSETTKDAFEQIGLNAEQMGQAIAEGGEAGEQAFQATLAALAAIEDPMARNAAGVALFGTQWEDVGEDVVLAMSEGLDGIENLEDATKKAGDAAYSNLGTVWESIKRQVMGALTDAATPALIWFSTVVQEHALPALQNLRALIEDRVIPAVRPFVEQIGEIIRLLAGGDFQGAFDAYIQYLGDLASVAQGLGTRIFDGIMGSLDTVTDAGIRIAGWLADQLLNADYAGMAGAIWSGVIGALTAVADAGMQFANWLIGAVTGVDWSGLASSLWSGIIAGLTALGDAAGQVAAWLTGLFSSVDWGGTAQSLVDGLITGFQAVQGFGQQVVDWISSQVGSADWGSIQQAIQSGLGSAMETINSLGENEGLQSFISLIEDKLAPVLEVISNDIMPVLQPTIDNLKASFDEIGATLEERAGPLLEQLKDTLDALKPVAETLGTVVGGVLVAALIGLGEFLAKVLPPAVELALDAIEGFLRLIETVAETVTNVVDLVKALIEGDWSKAWEEAQELVSDFVTGIYESLWPIIETVSGIFGDLMGAVIGILGSLGEWMLTEGGPALVSKLADGLAWLVSEAPGGVFHLWVNLNTRILELMGTLATWLVTEGGPKLVSELVSGLSNLFSEDNVVGALGQFFKMAEMINTKITALGTWLLTEGGPMLVGKIVSGLSDLFSEDTLVGGVGQFIQWSSDVNTKIGEIATEALGWAASVAGAFIQGLIDNMTSSEALSRVYEAAKSLGQSMLDGAKGILGIESPSKEAKRVGNWFMEGLLEGLEEMTDAIVQAIEDMTEALVKALEAGYPALEKAGVGAGEAVVGGTSKGMDSGAKSAGAAPAQAKPKPVGVAMGRNYGEGVAEGVVHTSKDNEESGKRVGGAVARGTSEGMDEEARRGGALPASAKPKPVGVAMGRDFGEGTAEGVVHTSKDNEDAGHRVGGAIARGTEEGMDAGARAGGALPASSHPRPVGVAVGRDFGEGAAEGVIHTSKDNYEAGHAAGAAAANGYNDGIKTVKTSKPGAGNAGGGETDNSQEPAYGTTITMNGLDLTYIGGGRWAGADGNVYVRGSDGSFQLESGSNTPNSPNTDAPPSDGGGGGGSPVGFLAGSVQLPGSGYTNAELYAASLLQNPLSRLNQPINLTLNVGNSQLISTVLDTALPGMSIEVGG